MGSKGSNFLMVVSTLFGIISVGYSVNELEEEADDDEMNYLSHPPTNAMFSPSILTVSVVVCLITLLVTYIMNQSVKNEVSKDTEEILKAAEIQIRNLKSTINAINQEKEMYKEQFISAEVKLKRQEEMNNSNKLSQLELELMEEREKCKDLINDLEWKEKDLQKQENRLHQLEQEKATEIETLKKRLGAERQTLENQLNNKIRKLQQEVEANKQPGIKWPSLNLPSWKRKNDDKKEEPQYGCEEEVGDCDGVEKGTQDSEPPQNMNGET